MNEDEFQEMKRGVKEILRIMNGNGKIGLCAKVNILWGSCIFLIGTVATQAWLITKILLK